VGVELDAGVGGAGQVLVQHVLDPAAPAAAGFEPDGERGLCRAASTVLRTVML
jgi:hypothetical protein